MILGSMEISVNSLNILVSHRLDVESRNRDVSAFVWELPLCRTELSRDTLVSLVSLVCLSQLWQTTYASEHCCSVARQKRESLLCLFYRYLPVEAGS